MALFDSRKAILAEEIPAGNVTAIVQQNPASDRFYELSISDLRERSTDDLQGLVKGNIELINAQFNDNPNLETRAALRDLASNDGPTGERFRDLLWTSSHLRGVANLRAMIINPDRALPAPHALFDMLLNVGQIRLPPKEVMELLNGSKLENPINIIKLAERLWSYTGFEGVAGNFSYRDMEDPPGFTKSEYHGSPSRAGIDLRTRVAWSDIYQTSLAARTPVALSNMEAASDRVSCKLAAEAGVMPFMFSSAREERLECARELGRNVFITVRTSEQEVALAKELLDLGANVHIELANSYNPKGLKLVMELKKYIKEKNFPEPRFVSIGKSVGGASYLACVLAGADLVVTNRGGSPICSTPEVTGRGLRTWSSCYEMSLAQHLSLLLFEKDVPFMADAGLRSGGDISRAASVGAEGGMVGTGFVRTIDSPTEKVLVNGEWYTHNFGDASGFANGKRAVSDQGIDGWFRIPKNSEGKPRTIKDVASSFSRDIQASIGDGGGIESFVQLPVHNHWSNIRVPGAQAWSEAASGTGAKPDLSKIDETRPSRLDKSALKS